MSTDTTKHSMISVASNHLLYPRQEPCHLEIPYTKTYIITYTGVITWHKAVENRDNKTWQDTSSD